VRLHRARKKLESVLEQQFDADYQLDG
jgi:hypothetical protein